MSPSSSARHNNGFDVLRLFAAWLVLWSHCYPLRGIPQLEPGAYMTEGLSFISVVAVYIFFAMSGYLVTRSWQRDPHVGRFILRRLLRIIPALAVVVLITFLIVGPWMSVLSVGAYFGDPASWRYLLNIFMYPIQHNLPGVFINNPFAEAVNGSLWTLRLEFSFYIIIALLGLSFLRRWGWILVAAAATSFFAFIGLDLVKELSDLPGHRQLVLIASNGIPFFLGAALARNERCFKIQLRHVLIVVALMAACYGLIPLKYILPAATAVITLFLEFRLKIDLGRWGDFSYGFYVWAFVVEQCVIHLFPMIGFMEFLLSCTAVTLLMAILSWHLVEKWALRLKPKTG